MKNQPCHLRNLAYTLTSLKTSSLLLFLVGSLTAQTLNDQRSFEFDLENIEEVYLINYEGNVNVVAHDRETGKIHIDRTLKSASQERISALRDSIRYDTMYDGNRLYFFIRDKNLVFKIDAEGEGYYDQRWSWYDRNKRDRYQIEHQFNIELALPPNIPLYIRTHRQDISVHDMRGRMIYLRAKHRF